MAKAGNYNERCERLIEAEEAWRHALDVDATEFDAALSLCKVHFETDRHVLAFGFLRVAIERFPQAKGMDPALRRRAAEAMVWYAAVRTRNR